MKSEIQNSPHTQHPIPSPSALFGYPIPIPIPIRMDRFTFRHVHVCLTLPLVWPLLCSENPILHCMRISIELPMLFFLFNYSYMAVEVLCLWFSGSEYWFLDSGVPAKVYWARIGRWGMELGQGLRGLGLGVGNHSGWRAVGSRKSNCPAVGFLCTQFIEIAFNGIFSAALSVQDRFFRFFGTFRKRICSLDISTRNWILYPLYYQYLMTFLISISSHSKYAYHLPFDRSGKLFEANSKLPTCATMKSDMPHGEWEQRVRYPACNVLLIE